MSYLKEPNTRGIWRIDLENTHVEQFDAPENGQWFAGYRGDGRAFVYDESTSTLRVESCHSGPDVRAEEPLERIPCDEPSIEHWVRENEAQIAALHPRYYWILEESGSE